MSAVIERTAVELLWRQWTALGVAGVAPHPAQAVDLEALIAFTPFVAHADPRLADEARDWCARIGPRFVSISRLRKITQLMPASRGGAEPACALMLLDKQAPKQAAPVSGKSRSPSLAHPSLLQLRSRYIFGVGARADVLSILAMRGRAAGAGRVSALRPAGYSKQAVATVLDELAEAGLLRKLSSATAVSFELVKEVGLRSMLSPLPARMPNWVDRFAIIANVLGAWRAYGARASYAIELAKVLDELRPMAAAAGERPPLQGKPPELIARIERWALALLQDDAWEDAWLFAHEDITHELQGALAADLIQAVHEGAYPVGPTELGTFAYKILDPVKGTAECRAGFTASHSKEALTLDGHVDATFTFDPDASTKAQLLASLKVTGARAHFDVGEGGAD